MPHKPLKLPQLNERSREIFRQIVDTYLTTGQPTGSRHISRLLPMSLSPASVRNVMSDLESLGLIHARHTSAGRLPTERGLRFFVDAVLEIGDIGPSERASIEAQVRAAQGRSFDEILAEASSLLSGLSRGAGVVLAAKRDLRLKHIEFLSLDPRRALVILVDEDGAVENRVLPLPPGLPVSVLVEASNYLNAHVRGRTLSEAQAEIARIRDTTRQEIDALTERMVEAGLATWAQTEEGVERQLIVRGQANLLGDLNALDDLERVRNLLEDIENKKDIIDLLGKAEQADGVRIYIGSENNLFSLSGSSMVAAPFRNAQQKIIGTLGVIGPTRLNYARIIPMVDYTAQMISRLMESE
jgi:heat-inducible transcriptional repressor